MTQRRASLVTLGLVAAVACAPRPTLPSVKEGPGLTKAAAFEVCQPEGERAYLARLRCADGSLPKIGQRGSYGPRGEGDGHIVDGYPLECPSASYVVFLDMYHCRSAPAREAPPGLLLSPEQ